MAIVVVVTKLVVIAKVNSLKKLFSVKVLNLEVAD